MAALTDSEPNTGLQYLVTYLGGPFAVRAQQRHVRNMDWCFALNNADLGAHITGASLVLLDKVNARDHYTITIVVWPCTAFSFSPQATQGLTTQDDTVHGSFQAFVISGYHFNSIAFSDLHRSLTSVQKYS